MARLVKPPPNAHDAHLKRLLDQRANRADLHAPSPSPSQYTDTSSVYTPSVFSPRPQRKHSDPSSYKYSLERLEDPASSVLDLDDDGHSSYDSSNPDDVDDRLDDDDSESQLRMSMLGPKMRFHSRAPWETGEDALEEESDSSARPIGSTSRSKVSGEQTSKPGGTRLGFNLSSSKSRNGSGGRPSNESTRSGTKSQQSFEITSPHTSRPHNIPPPLPSGPIPTISNLSSPSTSSQPVIRNNFLAAHGRSETSSLASASSNVPSPNPSPSAEDFRFSTPSPIPWVGDLRTHAITPPSYQQDEDMHPYANPDLVVTYEETSPLPSPIRPELAYSTVSRSDSNITVTDSVSTTSSRSTTLTPDIPSSPFRQPHQARNPRNRASTFQGRQISSPISFHKPGLRDAEDSVNPWNREPKLSLPPHLDASAFPGLSNNASPGFKLISLEEARAQRSRSATADASIPNPASRIAFPTRSGPLPKDDGNILSRPVSVVNTSSARVRSTSAGARARTALHSIVGPGSAVEGGAVEPATPSRQFSPSDNLVQGKGLKHKRSGLLRIFNAREKEKETPPPVPQLSDSYAASPIRKTTDHPADRIPTSQILQPPSNSSTAGQPPDFISNYTNGGSGKFEPSVTSKRKPSASPKRPPPTLSINTASQSQTARPPISATASECNRTEALSISTSDNNLSQSAPANVLDFPALKLRPISTTFSAHFREHFIKTDSDSEADVDTHSTTSSGHGTIPATPSSLARSDPASIGKIDLNSNNPSSIIRALQNQIATSKKAWQLEIWDLEGQVRDLKAELEDLRAAEKEHCTACGRGGQSTESQDQVQKGGVVNRPRARTGTSTRFGNGN